MPTIIVVIDGCVIFSHDFFYANMTISDDTLDSYLAVHEFQPSDKSLLLHSIAIVVCFSSL